MPTAELGLGGDQRATTRSLLIGAGSLVSGTLVARLLAYVFMLLMARGLTRAGFGALVIITASGLVLSNPVTNSFPFALARFLPLANGDERDRVVQRAALGTSVFLVLMIPFAILAAQIGSVPVWPLLVVTAGLSVDGLYFGILQGLQEINVMASYRVVANGAQLVIAITLLAFGVRSPTTYGLLYGFVYLPAIAMAELWRRRASGPSAAMAEAGRHHSASVQELVRFSVPTLLYGSLWGVFLGLDVFLLGYLSRHSVPDYGVARLVALPAELLPVGIATVALPRFAGASQAGRKHLLGQVVRLAIVTAVITVGAIEVGGQVIVTIFFPASYHGATKILRVMLPAYGAIGVYAVLSAWFQGVGRPWTAVGPLLGGASLAVALQLLLTRSLGGLGPAIGNLGGAAVALTLLIYFYFRSRPVVGVLPGWVE